MEHYFTSLTKRQTMLLLTAVTFDGAEAVQAFEHLPDEEADILKHRATRLMQIPKEQRIPMLVSELKRMVTSRRGILWSLDPVKLAEVLARERPALVDVLLRALPADLATSIRLYLPGRMATARREIKPEVLAVVRWKLDEILRKHAAPRATFRFSDVKGLSGRELLTLCDRLGVKRLAPAVAGLPHDDLVEFLNGLPPELKSAMGEAVRLASQRKLLEDDAVETVALHQDEKEPLDALRSAGAQKLVRAAMAQSPEFAQNLFEPHRAELPPSLFRWLKEEKKRTLDRGDGGRTEVVVVLEDLAKMGWVDPPSRVQLTRKPPLPSPASRSPGMAMPVRHPPDSTATIRDPIAERMARQAGATSSRKNDPPTERALPPTRGTQRRSGPKSRGASGLKRPPTGPGSGRGGRGGSR